MAIVTPSYRPDFARFRRLHESVLRCTDDSVVHHVMVPTVDVALYRSIDSPRLTVWAQRDVLPRDIIVTDRLAALTRRIPVLPNTFTWAAVSRQRPWRPIRGWVLQQLVKLSVGALEADVLVSVDSDVVMVRRFTDQDFVRDGAVRFYSVDGGITRSMERHFQWVRAAHELLGVPMPDTDTFPDHVTGIIAVDRRLLLACLERAEAVTGLPWAEAVARYRHFSEWILYGTYVRHFGSEHDRSFQTDSTPCYSYWGPAPLAQAEAGSFVAGFGRDHLGVNVQSNSGTSEDVTRWVITHLQEGIPT